MLFNSYEFIFAFLPIVLLVYYYLNRMKLLIGSKIWLLVCSLFFYSWWNVSFLPLILGSIILNFIIGRLLSSNNNNSIRRALLTFGILSNVGFLAYFKYADFFIININSLLKEDFPLLEVGLPLAISFFTFQQIAFLVDSYHKETNEINFLSYSLFVTFFPQLIAGPIVHHKEIMPQFDHLRNKIFSYKNQLIGMFIFSIGLFKKVILADTLSNWANKGFNVSTSLSLLEGWISSLSFTFQLYFDFSGYMDMATGAALLFNIILPINFNSPYKALSIQDSWNRWHITLGQFLYRYIFIPLNRFLLKKVFQPLGLKKHVKFRTNISLLLLFLISGLWHGAGWTFIFWGLLHGLATVTHRIWKHSKLKMNNLLAWFITFNFINFSMIFFRASSFDEAFNVIKGMLGLNGITLTKDGIFPDIATSIIYLIISFILILCFKNSNELIQRFKPTWYIVIFTIFLFVISVLHITKVSEFLYFNF